MPKIQHLSAHEAQKIAAGQVVERPADIIKELVENSIDANATAITLYVEQAGIALIRVVDNGCGMDREDAQRCFDKHATSKLRSMDELQAIQTFGFRGEAMPSIAAVCKVTLITRTADASEGVRVCVQENKVTSVDTVCALIGTDLSAADLFYTIPVRKKFLKKPETEWRHIVQLMQAFALAHITIHFKIISDEKEIYNWPAVTTVMSRCAQIWDTSVSRHMMPLEAHKQSAHLHLSGAISDHQQFRFDRSAIFIFVNNRWVKNFKLTNALINGYMNVAPAGRYPIACIALDIDPKLVDVNVHPRKEEIAFEHPVIVEQFIKQAVKERLERAISDYTKRPVSLGVPSHSSGATMMQSFDMPEVPFKMPLSEYDVNRALAYESFATTVTTYAQSVPSQVPIVSAPVESLVQMAVSADADMSAEFNTVLRPERAYTLIGQYHNTYLLLQQEDGLFVVDQHAAHERILYEKFGAKFDDVAVVSLLFATIISVSQADYQALLPTCHCYIKLVLALKNLEHISSRFMHFLCTSKR